ncbi:MAG: type II toxin-antitoxin system VapC family toxin [Deltaproteobacteria bacterium]|nr:type II toxin-antitoxin system VapC family toxin [Deltaproteobacteria bacterium]
MFLLDTNTLIYFFKGIGNVASNLLSKSPKDIGIPSIVIFELEVGIAKSQSPRKRIEQLKGLITVVNIIPFGINEAKAAAGIRAQLEQKGISIGPYDILISGMALTLQATLVTHNTKEFKRIPKLHVEDWY